MRAPALRSAATRWRAPRRMCASRSSDLRRRKLSAVPEDLYLKDWTVQRGGEIFPLQPLAIEYFGGYGCEFVGRGFFKVDEDLTTALNAQRLFWMPSWIGIEVDVDEETGRYVVTDFVVGTDAGRIINAAAMRGQVEGGALQGLGQAMFETLVYAGEQARNRYAAEISPAARDRPSEYGSATSSKSTGWDPGRSDPRASARPDSGGGRRAGQRDRGCRRCPHHVVPITPEKILVRWMLRSEARLIADPCDLNSSTETMMHEDVPIIDLDVVSVRPRQGIGCARGGRACETSASLSSSGHGVPADLVAETERVSHAFFDLPLEDKMKVAAGPIWMFCAAMYAVAAESLARSMGCEGTRRPQRVVHDRQPNVAGRVLFPGEAAGNHFAPNLWPERPPGAARRSGAPIIGRWSGSQSTSCGSSRSRSTSRNVTSTTRSTGTSAEFACDAIRRVPERQRLPQSRAGAHTDYGSLTILKPQDDRAACRSTRTATGSTSRTCRDASSSISAT